MDGQTLQHWASWTPLDFFPPFCEDKTTIWHGVRQRYYPFLLGPCWKCQFEVVLWKRTSSSLTVMPTSAVWEKPRNKFYDAQPFPPAPNTFCHSAISFSSRPLTKSTAIYSAEMGSSPLRPAAACTQKRPAAHLHAAPHSGFSYILTHSRYNTYWGWIN